MFPTQGCLKGDMMSLCDQLIAASYVRNVFCPGGSLCNADTLWGKLRAILATFMKKIGSCIDPLVDISYLRTS